MFGHLLQLAFRHLAIDWSLSEQMRILIATITAGTGHVQAAAALCEAVTKLLAARPSMENSAVGAKYL